MHIKSDIESEKNLSEVKKWGGVLDGDKSQGNGGGSNL